MQHETTGRKPNCVCKVCGAEFYTKPSLIRLRNGGQHCSRACHAVTLAEQRRGEGTPTFKGDTATVRSGRGRAQRAYRDLGDCENCDAAPAVDRHHKNGNTLDNRAENIALLCRRCHMAEDGRLKSIEAFSVARRKLSEAEAVAIWERLQAPPARGIFAQLAREFGVSDSTIRAIRDGRVYAAVIADAQTRKAA